MTLVNKKITPEELAERLVKSRKVMQKVDTGEYETGNINEGTIINDDSEILNDGERHTAPPSRVKIGHMDPNIIRQSKLPDNIKQAMIENPIPQISLNDSLDMNLVSRAKKLMEQEGIPTSKKPIKTTSAAPQLSESKLEKLIENAVRKVLDEKINQILAAQQLSTINENLVLKVGDSIFQGKITKVKSAK